MKPNHWWCFRRAPGIRIKPKVVLLRLPTRYEGMGWMLRHVQAVEGGRPSKRRIRRQIGRLRSRQ